HQQVLDRLLAEVVIDAKDLPFVARLQHQPVEGTRAGQVAPERLLDHHSREPRVERPGDQARGLQLLEQRGKRAGRRGEVVEPVAARGAHAIQLFELRPQARKRVRVVERSRHVAHAGPEVLPDLRIDRLRAREPAHRLAHFGGELLMRIRGLRNADDPERRRQMRADGEVVERGNELAVGEIAAGAEDDHRARLRSGVAAQPRPERIGDLVVLRRVGHRSPLLHCVAAELVAQRRLDLGAERFLLARGDAHLQGKRDHRSGDVLVDGRLYRPAPLAAVLDVAAPLVPASQKWIPRSASSFARRCESLKLEFPPSTMMSPFCIRAASEVTSSSVILPAGTIVQQTRGGMRAAITSSRVVAGAAPAAASSAARRESTSYAITLCPPCSKRCTMLPPIRPRPSIASCMAYLPGDTMEWCPPSACESNPRASRNAATALFESPSSTWTRSARRPCA